MPWLMMVDSSATTGLRAASAAATSSLTRSTLLRALRAICSSVRSVRSVGWAQTNKQTGEVPEA
jgi:hypothetical protein